MTQDVHYPVAHHSDPSFSIVASKPLIGMCGAIRDSLRQSPSWISEYARILVSRTEFFPKVERTFSCPENGSYGRAISPLAVSRHFRLESLKIRPPWEDCCQFSGHRPVLSKRNSSRNDCFASGGSYLIGASETLPRTFATDIDDVRNRKLRLMSRSHV